MAITKNRNLNDRERTYVCLKIKEFYDHRNGVFLRGGRQEVKKRCDRANIGVSIDTIRRYAREMRDQERAATDVPSGEVSGVDLSPNLRGKCGAKTKLTPTLQEGYRKVIERYAYSWRYLTRRELQRELFKETGQHVSLGGIQIHLKKMNVRTKTIKIKPILTEENKKKRVRYCLDLVDKSHGRDRLEFKLEKNMFHVDESRFYITKESFKALLIEEMDVLIAPQTQHKSHIQKVMFLSVIGVPQVVEYEGKVYNFDGKIGLFPCAEKKPTQRRSKAGPKGTMVEVNRNVDSEFYEELFTKKGGVFDMIEKICPWLRGKYYFLQQDGARPHTKEGLIRQLEMQVGTGEDNDFFCKFYAQPANSPDVNINDLAFFHSIKTRAMRKKSHCLTIAEKMIHVQEAFKGYPKDKITDIWACYFNNLRGIMKETGGNQYKPAHNNSRNRRKETGSPIDLRVNVEDYIRCLDFLID